MVNSELKRQARRDACRLTQVSMWQLHIMPVLPPVATLKKACVRYPFSRNFLISSRASCWEIFLAWYFFPHLSSQNCAVFLPTLRQELTDQSGAFRVFLQGQSITAMKSGS